MPLMESRWAALISFPAASRKRSDAKFFAAASLGLCLGQALLGETGVWALYRHPEAMSAK